jgi:hypothetical protein
LALALEFFLVTWCLAPENCRSILSPVYFVLDFVFPALTCQSRDYLHCSSPGARDMFPFSLADSAPKGLLLIVGSGAESRTKVLIFVFLARQSTPVASKFQPDSATCFGRRLLLLFDYVCSVSVLWPLLFFSLLHKE